MAVQIISRDSIKPSSPTPQHLRHLKLSFLDQIAPAIYTPLLLFYPPSRPLSPNSDKSQLLKSSLSQTLTRFYPFAGRIKDNLYIDCNDSGADYLEAQVSGKLAHVLEKPDPQMLRQFLPTEIESTTGTLLALQVTFFDCGGLAVGVCVSHKIAEAPSLSTFVNSWAATALSADGIIVPRFVMASLFPAREFSIPTTNLVQHKCVTSCRFVFNASQVAKIKALAGGTRVESVTALIWKSVVKESRVTDEGSRKPSFVTHAVNMRKSAQPPYEDAVIGNFSGMFAVEHDGKVEPELRDLVRKMRKGFVDHMERVAEEGWGKEVVRMLGWLRGMAEEGGVERYTCSSWCGFPLYQVDFGWGRPAWASITGAGFLNMVLLMDARDGKGVEAWIALEEDHMHRLQINPTMLAFASVDPPVSLPSSPYERKEEGPDLGPPLTTSKL